MALATLSVDLVAKLAQFEGDLGKAARASEKTAERINQAFSRIGGALAVLGAGISVAGLVSATKAAVDGVDALNDLKDATGASVENLSALEDVALRTGTSMDTVATAVVKFNKVLADTKPGTDAARAFDVLGLSLAELKTLDPAEALLRTAKALSGFADDGDKARLTQELFGKSLKEVAPFLKDLAEKGQLVATVTTKQAEEAEKFNKELFAMQKNSQDLARFLAGPMVEGLNKAAEKFREGTAAAKGFFETTVSILKTSGSIYANNVRQVYGIQTKPLNTGGATGDFGPGAGGGRGSVNPEFVKPSVGDIFTDPKKKTGSAKKSEEITEAQRALASYVESLSKVLEKNDDLTASEKALNFLRTQGVQGHVPQVRELVLGLAAQVDLEKELAERLKLKRDLAIEAGDAVNKSNEEYQALLGRLLAATPTAKLAEQRADVRALTAEFEAGRINEELYLEAVSARLDLAGEGYKKMSSFAERAVQNIQDALGDSLADVLQRKFDNIGDSFTKMINRMVAEAAAAKVVENLFGSKGGGGGALSGVIEEVFGGLFSFEGGGFTGSGARSGGADGKGGFLAMLHPQETVVDHTRGQGRGNTVNVTVNQSFAPGTTRATTLQAAADARRQLEYSGRNL